MGGLCAPRSAAGGPQNRSTSLGSRVLLRWGSASRHATDRVSDSLGNPRWGRGHHGRCRCLSPSLPGRTGHNGVRRSPPPCFPCGRRRTPCWFLCASVSGWHQSTFPCHSRATGSGAIETRSLPAPDHRCRNGGTSLPTRPIGLATGLAHCLQRAQTVMPSDRSVGTPAGRQGESRDPTAPAPCSDGPRRSREGWRVPRLTTSV